jgi:diguanylate cyclase (GGDEF)-like protein
VIPAVVTILALATSAILIGLLAAALRRSARLREELRYANEQMLAAQADLRRLADRDPLTGLANRRTLPEIFRRVQPQGATIIFFDLNGFKRINDQHGHQEGDRCLVRFAVTLANSFRPSDAIIRYGGDEFLVVAPGLDEAILEPRIEQVRARMRASADGELPVHFSCGIGLLAAGGSPDDALHAADAAMYRAKPAVPDRDDLALPSSSAAWLVR